MTTVINIRQAPAGWKQNPRYVYIGRGAWWQGNRIPISMFNNPYPMRNKSAEERQRVIDAFRQYFYNNDHLLRASVIYLTDKILVCWCKPEACHGDILAEWVNAEDDID